MSYLHTLQVQENNETNLVKKNRLHSVRQALCVLHRDAYRDAMAAYVLVNTLLKLGMIDAAKEAEEKFGAGVIPPRLSDVYDSFLRHPIQPTKLSPQPVPEPVVGVHLLVVYIPEFAVHTRTVDVLPDDCEGDFADRWLQENDPACLAF